MKFELWIIVSCLAIVGLMVGFAIYDGGRHERAQLELNARVDATRKRCSDSGGSPVLVGRAIVCAERTAVRWVEEMP